MVDAQLIIYNTTNVRVVDASIIPLQLSAHLSASLYGVAEKAADLIKAAAPNATSPSAPQVSSTSAGKPTFDENPLLWALLFSLLTTFLY